MSLKSLFISLCLILSCFLTNAQNVNVDATAFSPQELVEDILVGMGCVENVNVTNAVSGNFGTQEFSYGYFTNNNGSFPFAEGVVLSTGRLENVAGPNDSLSDDDAGGWVGDADLESALGINNTINATIIEFDFTPLESNLDFRYIFASEEYRDNNVNTCNFSDAFAFLIREQGSMNQYENIAVIPGTNTPVLVTTVRPDIFDNGMLQCAAENEEFFGSFNGTNAPINFNGQTAILSAQTTVVPNTTYHIKLVIADEGNARFDSAVFLEARSFGFNTDLGEDRLLSDGTAACENDIITLQALEAPMGETYSYNWFRNGTLQPETSSMFQVMQDGTYRVEVTLTSGCMIEDEIVIEYFSGNPTNNATLEACDQNEDGVEIFNLLDARPDILNGQSGLFLDGFYTSQMGAETANPSEEINNVNTYTASTPMDIVYARVMSQAGCVYSAELTLFITQPTPLNPEQLDACGINGIGSFNLNDANALFNMQTMPNTTYSYFRTIADAENDADEITDLNYENETPTNQTLIVVAENNQDCYGYVELNLVITETPQLLPDETITNCFDIDNQMVTLNAGATNDNGSFTYAWSTGETTETIMVDGSGTFTVTATNTNGVVDCMASRTITVEESFTTQVNVVVSGDFPNYTVTINANGSNNFTYSLDNINGPYQDSNIFTNVEPGEHTAYVRNGTCGIVSQPFAVLNFPEFFTPNGDGFNDFWNVSGNDLAANNVRLIYLFDRYGKLLKTLSPNTPGWDGTYNGQPLPSSDYWFLAEFQSGFEFKNHFTLKR